MAVVRRDARRLGRCGETTTWTVRLIAGVPNAISDGGYQVRAGARVGAGQHGVAAPVPSPYRGGRLRKLHRNQA
jgi:hypothetical protein